MIICGWITLTANGSRPRHREIQSDTELVVDGRVILVKYFVHWFFCKLAQQLLYWFQNSSLELLSPFTMQIESILPSKDGWLDYKRKKASQPAKRDQICYLIIFLVRTGLIAPRFDAFGVDDDGSKHFV